MLCTQSGVRFSSRVKPATARECSHERPSSQGSGSPGIWLSLLVLLPSCLLLSWHSLLWPSLICGLSSSWCVWVSLYCSPPLLLPLPAHLPGLQIPGPWVSQRPPMLLFKVFPCGLRWTSISALLCRGHCISRQGLCPVFSAQYLVVGGQGPLCVAGSPVHCRVLSDPGLYPLVSDMVWDGPGGNEVGGYCSHMSFFRDRSPLPVAQRRGDTLEASPLQSCTLVYRLAPRLWASVPPSSLARSSITQ